MATSTTRRFFFPLLLLSALGASACDMGADGDIGVIQLLVRTAPDEKPEPAPGCVLLVDGEGGGGGPLRRLRVGPRGL